MIDLDKLETLDKAATPGHWLIDQPAFNSARLEHFRNDDRTFIVEARKAIPELIAELRAARAVVEYVASIADLDGCEELQAYRKVVGRS
jgi:hypothetical protein